MAKTKTASRIQRSNQELQRASLAVQYEVATLGGTHEMLHKLGADWGSSPQDQAMSNALLHTFLLAARNLLAFLYSYNPRPTDIIAEDFFDNPKDWTSQRCIPEPEMGNGELIGFISKRLAHLTWDRAETNKPLWGAFRIIWNIGLTLESFLKLVNRSKIHSNLTDDFEITMNRLRAVVACSGGLEVVMAPAQDSITFDELAYFQDR